jgi:dUTP pyrophosphatase
MVGIETIKIGFYPLVPKARDRIPKKATEEAAGWDIQACLSEPCCLKPGKRCLIPTGFAFLIPRGFEGQLRPRSGWAFHSGITLLNSPGTIDADYRGEVKVLLINLGEKEVWIKDADRIAQLIVSRVIPVTFDVSDKIQVTSRGSGGFGHTGK